MKKRLTTIIFLCILIALPIYGQENKVQEISSIVKNYFSLERENIHVHFNKTTFITNESIWFKGYVYYSKKNTPFFTTTNIFAVLKNAENKTLDSKLLYGSLGSFEGNFELPPNMVSGTYYLQFYTNWMNNFKEDQSAIYKIEVINPNTPGQSTTNDAGIEITTYPEGGTFLKNKTNTLVVSVKGCKNQPLPVTEVNLYSHNEIIQTIPLDNNGYGKFEYYAVEEITTDSLKVTFLNKTYKTALPKAQKKGITLKFTNKTGNDASLLELKTNKDTYPDIENKPFYILIHKDDNAFLLETKFTDNVTDQEMLITDNYLFDGLTTIRIIDSDLNEVAQRLIYKDFENDIPVNIIETIQENGNILFTAQTTANTNLSITVLPLQTKTLNNNSILNDFLLAPYIKNHPDINISEYFNNSKETNKNLDLYLICSNSKYIWETMKQNPPKENYTFDMGLKIKGVINQKLKRGKKYLVKVTSFGTIIDEEAEIVNNNEFYFDNLILADSCKLDFELLENDKNITPKIYLRTLNNTSQYNHPFTPNEKRCITDKVDEPFTDLPNIQEEAIRLKDVVIEEKREKLKHAVAFGNGQLRGRKITEAESIGFPTVLDLIRYEGFEVRNRPDSAVAVYGRSKNTFVKGLKNSPDVFLDDYRLVKLDILRDILTSEIDEFYINKHMSVPTLQNRIGIIKIYRKRKAFSALKDKPVYNYVLENGFEKIKPFTNTTYTNGYSGSGFNNYGLIHWIPTTVSDENGKFSFSIPQAYKGEAKLIIEGFSPEGKIISQVITINL
ncbi:hypothetical protein Q763_15730 [Flavobacterium beibuense F44-8]|uniref:Uncharacterized protein n=1 Tax=Flavobacterium beibuense F44-8 TaxID=1406840 RepID=A0A0A2LFM2_9FLAO|nr:hypothetical protein [Flavobacterium beibuense]KGO78962.1 hypothetical protein Q763_15730 [Flavobacterium beibuense F44-8]